MFPADFLPLYLLTEMFVKPRGLSLFASRVVRCQLNVELEKEFVVICQNNLAALLFAFSWFSTFFVKRVAIHFAIQRNLTTPFRRFPIRHMLCSSVCTIENHTD